MRELVISWFVFVSALGGRCFFIWKKLISNYWDDTLGKKNAQVAFKVKKLQEKEKVE